MTRHADVPLWVQVGDIASNEGGYFAPSRPIYWIKGNNEDFDVIAASMAGHPPASTLHYLANGGPHQVGPWRVAALAGHSHELVITRRPRRCAVARAPLRRHAQARKRAATTNGGISCARKC